MSAAAIVLGVLICVGAGLAEARYVVARCTGRRIPAFGHPNIHNWGWLGSDVPLPVLCTRAAALIIGLFLIVPATVSFSPAWVWVGLGLFAIATVLPIEVVRRHHNRSLTRH